MLFILSLNWSLIWSLIWSLNSSLILSFIFHFSHHLCHHLMSCDEKITCLLLSFQSGNKPKKNYQSHEYLWRISDKYLPLIFWGTKRTRLWSPTTKGAELVAEFGTTKVLVVAGTWWRPPGGPTGAWTTVGINLELALVLGTSSENNFNS